MTRVCAYVDGFNLYHAIDRLKDNRLKWLDLQTLIRHFLDPNLHTLEDVYYFSAFATWRPDAYKRHIAYEEALRTSGVNTVMGKFKNKSRSCRNCDTTWMGHEEKETDVNIALHLLNDAYRDRYDEAIIISQDSDLFPAIKMVKTNFPHKSIKIITPPNMHHSKEMAEVAGKKKLGKIKLIHLERSLFPENVMDGTGNIKAKRPVKYASR